MTHSKATTTESEPRRLLGRGEPFAGAARKTGILFLRLGVIDMIIMALDIASSTGWAVYDTDKHQSAIRCGAFHLTRDCPKGALQADRRRHGRDALISKLGMGLRKVSPDIVVLERPLDAIMANPVRGRKAPLLPVDEPEQAGGGANATTVILLNQFFATAYAVCALAIGQENVFEVAPRTWQTITKPFGGKDTSTKDRSLAFCKSLGVTLPPTKAAQIDAADAVAIAFWAAGHCQEIKLMMARAA